MAIELIRVDDRLLHGQVLVGWGRHLDLSWYAVVDDDLAAAPAEQEMYAAGVPEGVEVLFLSVDGAGRAFSELDRREEPGCLLAASPQALVTLAEEGALKGRRVVVGPLGDMGNRRRVLDFLHLGPEEERALRELERSGAEVVAREVPSSRAVPLGELLDAS